jgi:PAS domain S-box-containing protein
LRKAAPSFPPSLLASLQVHGAQRQHVITHHREKRASGARLIVAIEQAADSVVVTDAEGTIQYVNPMFAKVTGYSRAEAIGQNPRLLKSGKHDESFYRELWETIGSGRVWEGGWSTGGRTGR